MLFRRTADERKMYYLEHLMTNNQEAKEIRIFGLGEYLLDNWKSLFQQFYSQDRRVAVRFSMVMTATTIVQTTAGMGFYGWCSTAPWPERSRLEPSSCSTQAMEQCLGTMGSIVQSLGTLYESSLFLSNLSEFFQQKPILNEPSEPCRFPGQYTADCNWRTLLLLILERTARYCGT